MVAGSLLGSMAGTVLGSMVAQHFFGGHPEAQHLFGDHAGDDHSNADSSNPGHGIHADGDHMANATDVDGTIRYLASQMPTTANATPPNTSIM